MRRSITVLSAVIILGIIISACKKKTKTPPDPVPYIEIVSVTPSTVTQFKDSVLIKINYKDANGDLGDLSPDEHSLYVKDSRLPNADTYHVKPLAPMTGDDISINGQITIKLNSLFLLGTGTTELTTLSIKIKDRAGNWSPEVTSPQITINQ